MVDRTAEAREWESFCTELPRVRALARETGWYAELERALERLRDGTQTVAAVAQWARDNSPVPVRRRGYTPVPGQQTAPPPPGSYTCPGRRCPRSERRKPGAPLPECAAFDEPMSFG